MQQDLFLTDEIDESVKALKFIPLTSAEKVLDARIIRPTADGIVTWGDGFVTDLNDPQGPLKHIANRIYWDYLGSMLPHFSGENFYARKINIESQNRSMQPRYISIYPALYIPIKISKVRFSTIPIHQLLWDIYRPEPRSNSIDHIDGNPGNYHFSNLRMTKNNNWNRVKNPYSVSGVFTHINIRTKEKKWKSKHCGKYTTLRYSEFEAARDRIFIMQEHPDCQPSDIEASIRRILTVLAYRERNCIDAFGKTVPLEDLDVRVPEWLSYPVEHFLKHQPALQS